MSHSTCENFYNIAHHLIRYKFVLSLTWHWKEFGSTVVHSPTLHPVVRSIQPSISTKDNSDFNPNNGRSIKIVETRIISKPFVWRWTTELAALHSVVQQHLPFPLEVLELHIKWPRYLTKKSKIKAVNDWPKKRALQYLLDLVIQNFWWFNNSFFKTFILMFLQKKTPFPLIWPKPQNKSFCKIKASPMLST